MKLCIRDVFGWRDSRWRIVAIDKLSDAVWIIDLADQTAWPVKVSPRDIEGCEREVHSESLDARRASAACSAKLEGDYSRVQRILNARVDLFDSEQRRFCIEKVAQQTERCARTLETLLRRWWQRGMTKSALIADFANCGRRDGGETAGRGRPAASGRAHFQVTAEDHLRFELAVNYYFADDRRTLGAAYQWLSETSYSVEDGNGRKYLPEFGERPTYRQFAHYLNRKYATDERLKRRHGKKEYAKDHKPTLSDTIADCLGIGHRYEIDASIADVDIVLDEDRTTIIGKATIYLIVDRKCRLIPGFYLGLDPPCWETAAESIISLVESKQELCARYGVEYDPRDWPADGILPAELIGDHGEMFSKYSNSAPELLGVTIANPASLMPNHKPNVETRFKLITVDLRKITPGYEPPEYFGKRRKKHYEKEACLTLRELIREVLEAIIKHNRTPIADYPRSVGEIVRKVEPSPIALWHDGEKQTGCLGRRFDDETVRLALLPRATAKTTQDGILFKNLYYASDDPRLTRAFIRARKGRDEIEVSYDRRYIDCIYVHLPDGAVLATLSEKNHGYRGLSFKEAEIVVSTAQGQREGHDHTRMQVAFESNQRRAPRIKEAEKKRDELGPLSVEARKANSKAARAEQKRRENIDRAQRQMGEAASTSVAPEPKIANVAGIPVRNRIPETATAPLTAAQLARKRMA